MAVEPITRELVESVAEDAVVSALSALADRLTPPRSVVVAPSDRVAFFAVPVATDGVLLLGGSVDRLRVTIRNRDAATSVYLHNQGQPDPVTYGVELPAGASMTLATRDSVWAAAVAGTVTVDLVVESVAP